MSRDAVSRTANVGTVGKNGLTRLEKSNTNQTYSCPRDKRLSQHYGASNELPPEIPLTIEALLYCGIKEGLLIWLQFRFFKHM